MNYEAVQVTEGYAVRCEQTNEYVGRDGFWVRSKRNATPFSTQAKAEAFIGSELDRDENWWKK